jgi:uncharacterized protein (DUF2141 family)
LTVNIETDSLSGSVHVRLYSERDGYPAKTTPTTQLRTIELATQRFAAFPDLPAGTYAVVVFHDVNEDGDIATNWLGIPTEPVGVYIPPDTRLWGPPSFRRTSFDVTAQDRQIPVSLVTP